MEHKSITVEREVARIAGRQHGVVTRSQLLNAGVSVGEIRGRVDRGLLLRVHQGVYRVGHDAPSLHATYMAAVLACGPGALLCGLAAAHLFRLVKEPPPEPEVLAPKLRRVPGITTHRTRRPVRRTTCWGIPTTTIPETLRAISSELAVEDLALAFHEANVRYGTTPDQVDTTGRPKLRRAIHGEPVTLSRLERDFLKRLDAAGLPRPITNRRAGSKRVDCRWPDHALTVELDSYRYHRTRHAWEQDRRRDREARARGDEIHRYTWTDVHEDPGPMMRELGALLRG